MQQKHEIRDPVHGFIWLNQWEWDIVNHWVFQRMRRIKQLGLTEMVYPGATHTRFEHSLGVMHIATQMYDAIVEKSKDILINELGYNDDGLRRDRQLVRLSALLHDVGHSPFSHAGEELMPTNSETGKKFKHEDYSASAVEHCMQDVIDNHKENENYGIKAQNVAGFLSGKTTIGRALVWRILVTSQFDADRADYLLRDSHHIGVAYGRFDLHRFLNTLVLVNDPESGSPMLGIEQGGIHAAEALILARYMMFTQVYFHHTRRAYDWHLGNAFKEFLGATFKKNQAEVFFPEPKNIEDYLKLDDWKALGFFAENQNSGHAKLIVMRQHYRSVFETSETPDEQQLEYISKIQEVLKEKIGFIDKASSSWYKFESAADVLISTERGKIVKHLSALSSVVRGLKAINQMRIYTPVEYKKECLAQIEKMKG